MRAIPPRQLRELRAVLKSISAGRHVPWRDGQRLLETVDAALVPKRSAAPAKKRRASKKATRKEKTAAVREAVMRRANGRCECGCNGEASPTNPLELDHFFGGSNRRALESLEGCWALTRLHHGLKTANGFPGTMGWLSAFREHCLRHGYHEAARRAEARLDSLRIQSQPQVVS